MSECRTCVHKGHHLSGPAEKLPPPCNICDGGSHYAEKGTGIVIPPMTIPVDQRNGKPLVTTAMKHACIGEFSWEEEAPYYDENGTLHADHVQKITVPWTICKEIYKVMAAVAARA